MARFFSSGVAPWRDLYSPLHLVSIQGAKTYIS